MNIAEEIYQKLLRAVEKKGGTREALDIIHLENDEPLIERISEILATTQRVKAQNAAAKLVEDVGDGYGSDWDPRGTFDAMQAQQGRSPRYCV